MSLGYEKLEFLTLPTPMTRLDNLSEELGVNFYLKRDDMTNYGTGGNKLRKLEYFVKDAMDKGSTMLLTVGGAQTNHGRLTAAVAAKYNMKCAIIAVDPYPGELSANMLLDAIMGCPVYLVQDDGIRSPKEQQEDAVKKVTAEWEAKGEKVYFIPMGGSDELGILGYYDCALEIYDQMKELNMDHAHLISTVGSMGTYMGLQVGIKNNNLPVDLTGVCIMPYRLGIMPHLLEYYERIKKFFNLDLVMTEKDFDVTEEYIFGAYNNPVKEVRESIYYLARKEAIIMDPCYTGKTLTGTLDMIKKGKIRQGENLILLHTGGIPGIYTKHHRLEMEKELIDYVHII